MSGSIVSQAVDGVLTAGPTEAELLQACFGALSRLEAQVQAGQRLAAQGESTAAVVDKIQTPLRGLRGFLDQLRREVAAAPAPAPAHDAVSEQLIGRSPALREVVQRLTRAARSKATVLLEGESGTGKERLAALVHARSPRRAGPFVKVNCAALAEGVLESELFGHERGAFTGAHERRVGRFELASGGTILLDEVGEVSTSVQAKLLRVLEEEELERVGGNRTISLDVRVVAATNRDLRQEVAAGRFREDLYYRLAVMPIRVPPLRERTGDVALLVDHFLQVYAAELGQALGGFSPAALELLASYHWPGNVRELENVVRRQLALLDPGEVVEPRHLAPYLAPSVEAAQAPGTIRDLERDAIERALASTGGNRDRAARQLGISVRTLYNRLKRYQRAGDPIDMEQLKVRAA